MVQSFNPFRCTIKQFYLDNTKETDKRKRNNKYSYVSHDFNCLPTNNIYHSMNEKHIGLKS